MNAKGVIDLKGMMVEAGWPATSVARDIVSRTAHDVLLSDIAGKAIEGSDFLPKKVLDCGRCASRNLPRALLLLEYVPSNATLAAWPTLKEEPDYAKRLYSGPDPKLV